MHSRRQMPGGFIGVDIFFVISGFLITGIIARELDQQRFNLLAF
jgi:peptidoglycan/LPS O-acetylase OafA/YrhL